MIFNSQSAEAQEFINGGEIELENEITLPRRVLLLGDLTIKPKPVLTEEVTVTPGEEAKIITPSAGKYLSKVTVAGDPDLIPENIAEGINIFGILGTHIGGAKGIDFGEVQVSSGSSSVTVNHKLGVTPSFVALIPKTFNYGSYTDFININGQIGYRTSRFYYTTVTNTVTDNSITFAAFQGYYANTYYWIAIQ